MAQSHATHVYVAKPVDKKGFAHYTSEENAIWQQLFSEQRAIIQNRACEEYLLGLDLLNLPKDKIPQCPEVSDILQEKTGWRLEPVLALISFDYFFELLATRRFPVATFIRRKEDLRYIKEPDIFHEIFGHCPLLTHPAYAEFIHLYGKLGHRATKDERVLLARIFWFTVEFGLVNTSKGLRAYGAGILSSQQETVYALEDKTVSRKPFEIHEILSTSYHIDALQKRYFILGSFDQLYKLATSDLLMLIRKHHQVLKRKPRHPC